MANLNAPMGAIAKFMRNGAREVPLTPYYVKSDYATALYIGDPVSRIAGDANAAPIKLAPGSLVGGADNFPIGTLQKVERAVNGDAVAITGFIVHIGFSASHTSVFGPGYKPASTEAVVWVADDPNTVFEMQCTTAIAATDIGKVTNLTGSGGSAYHGLSAATVDGSAIATGNATYQLRLIGLSKTPYRNDGTAVNCTVYVLINNHTDVDVAKAGV